MSHCLCNPKIRRSRNGALRESRPPGLATRIPLRRGPRRRARRGECECIPLRDHPPGCRCPQRRRLRECECTTRCSPPCLTVQGRPTGSTGNKKKQKHGNISHYVTNWYRNTQYDCFLHVYTTEGFDIDITFGVCLGGGGEAGGEEVNSTFFLNDVGMACR